MICRNNSARFKLAAAAVRMINMKYYTSVLFYTAENVRLRSLE